MQIDEIIRGIALAAMPILSAITLHEAAHGYVARHFGDNTAERAGRISLNPIRHIDPVGTILLPVLLYLATAGMFTFGWAKPVPVNFGALRHPKRDMLWVALAGPASNLFMALCWALLVKIALVMQDNYFAAPLQEMAQFGILLNVVLAVLNLIPLPPLDGGRIAVSLLPYRQALQFSRIERYGMLILIFLLVSGVLGQVLWPVVGMVIAVINYIIGL